MISPNKRITVTSLKQCAEHLNTEDLIKGIRNKKGHQIKIEYSTPLINNLKIKELFKDKNKEKGAGVIDFINRIV